MQEEGIVYYSEIRKQNKRIQRHMHSLSFVRNLKATKYGHSMLLMFVDLK